jgi:hypothetical protein
MASITAVSVLTLGWVSGCSVLYDLSTKQCSADADCVALGGSFESLVCVDNLCQAPPVTGCTSNAQCIDEQGMGYDPYACVERETAEGSRRIEKECVKLTTTECPTMLPQTGELWLESLRTDNPVILAGAGLIGGTTFLDQRLRNYDLALTELTNTNLGLPSNRQVVMIGCQGTFENADELDREMVHLANAVKVPGIIASFFADDLQRAFNDYGKEAQMFFMSPLESDPTLAALQDNGLIWHIGPATDVLARAYAPLFTRTLAHLGLTSGVKVATVVTTDVRFLANMVPTIEAAPAQYGLSFNGMNVTDNRNADNYVKVNITSGSMSSVSAQVAEILDLQPNVIVSAADGQFIRRMIPAIESGWPASGPPKPFYLLSPFSYNDPGVQNLLQSNSSLVSRIAGVNGAAATDTGVYDDYVGRFQAAFPEYAEDLGYENFYDAAYYLLYAAAGAGQNLANGQNLLDGMNRLMSGAGPYDVGPVDMPTAMGTLAAGSATIQLNGTLGPPDWNRINGTRESVGSVWCIDSTRTFRSDVLRYVTGPGNDPTQATLSGTFPCIDGF